VSRLSLQRRAELLAALRLREALTNKALAARFNVDRRTLTRLRAEILDAPHAPLSQFGTQQHSPPCSTSPDTEDSKP